MEDNRVLDMIMIPYMILVSDSNGSVEDYLIKPWERVGFKKREKGIELETIDNSKQLIWSLWIIWFSYFTLFMGVYYYYYLKTAFNLLKYLMRMSLEDLLKKRKRMIIIP